MRRCSGSRPSTAASAPSACSRRRPRARPLAPSTGRRLRWPAGADAQQDLLRRRPFAGVPFLLKDLGLAAVGLPSQMGSRLFGTVDRRAGAVARSIPNWSSATGPRAWCCSAAAPRRRLGISATTEARAYGRPTRNPWNLGAQRRRLQRRRGGGGGGPAGADGARLRRRRIDPHPGELLRPRRPQAQPRADARRPPERRGLGRLRDRARADADGARLCPRAGRHRRRDVGAPACRAGRCRSSELRQLAEEAGRPRAGSPGRAAAARCGSA